MCHAVAECALAVRDLPAQIVQLLFRLGSSTAPVEYEEPFCRAQAAQAKPVALN